MALRFPNQSSVMTNYGSTPDPSESFVSSDTCPETPDSSVKEEGDVNFPDTGSYASELTKDTEGSGALM